MAIDDGARGPCHEGREHLLHAERAREGAVRRCARCLSSPASSPGSRRAPVTTIARRTSVRSFIGCCPAKASDTWLFGHGSRPPGVGDELPAGGALPAERRRRRLDRPHPTSVWLYPGTARAERGRPRPDGGPARPAARQATILCATATVAGRVVDWTGGGTGGLRQLTARWPRWVRGGERVVTLVGYSRLIWLSGHRPQSQSRRLVTMVRFPSIPPKSVSAGRPSATGSRSPRRSPSALPRVWTQAGLVVAAPVFARRPPWGGGGPDEADIISQPRDMSFVITRMLAASFDRRQSARWTDRSVSADRERSVRRR